MENQQTEPVCTEPVPVSNSRPTHSRNRHGHFAPGPPRPPLLPHANVKTLSPVVVSAESIFDDDLLYRSRVQTLFQREPSFSSASHRRRKEPSRLLPSIAIAVAFLSVGYVFSEPLYSHGNSTSVVQLWGRALDRTQSWLHSSNDQDEQRRAVQMAQDDSPILRHPAAHHAYPGNSGARSISDHGRLPSATPDKPQQCRAGSSAPSRPQAPAATAVHIPESLKNPTQAATMRSVAARITPSLLAALEPVELSEDLSRRLLLQKVLPSYPEKAVRDQLAGTGSVAGLHRPGRHHSGP